MPFVSNVKASDLEIIDYEYSIMSLKFLSFYKSA